MDADPSSPFTERRDVGVRHSSGPATPRRDLPPPHALDAILRPRSVAVIGASHDPGKRGNRVVAALGESGYRGAVYPVNPKGGEIAGLSVLPSLADVPGTPDLALICRPAAAIPEVIAECGRRGVPGAVVLAVGFAEAGASGRKLDRAVRAQARKHGVRIVGPNTSGILNLSVGLNLIGFRSVRAGHVSLIVQSGNIALDVVNGLMDRTNEGVAACIGLGNAMDVGFAECLDFLGDDPNTEVILVHSEDLGDVPEFLRVASRVTRAKPVVLVKGGRSEEGQRAALSHTGALSSRHDLLSVGLRQAGIVEMERTDELVHLAAALRGQPPARASAGVAVLTDGGGQATLAVDALSDLGVPLARLGRDTQGVLRERLGPAATVSNPVDVAGSADSDPGVFADAARALVADPQVGLVLLVGLFGGYGVRFSSDLAQAERDCADSMARTARGAAVPLVVHSMYVRTSASRSMVGESVPVVESLDVAVRVVAELWRRAAQLKSEGWSNADRHRETPSADPGGDTPVTRRPDRHRARDMAVPKMLSEPAAVRLLSGFGVRFPDHALCRTQAEVSRAASELGFPVAMKAVSAMLPHKTEAGGVVLDVPSGRAARHAFRDITRRTCSYLKAHGHDPVIDGVMVSSMLPTPVAEILVGARRDAHVGPVLTVGEGGILAEIYGDVAHRLLPASEDDIAEMLTELRIHRVLCGYRGKPSADLNALKRTLLAVANCLLSKPEVAEIEVNPLFALPDDAVAADAFVAVRLNALSQQEESL